MSEQSSKTFGLSGEYTNESTLRYEARRFFFEMIRTVHPAPLYSLRDDVFPEYKRWADEQKAAQGHPTVALGNDPVYHSFHLLQEHAPDVSQAISRWAHRFHLTGECGSQLIDETSLDPLERLLLREQAQIASWRAIWPSEHALKTLWMWHFSQYGAEMMNTIPPEWVRVLTLSGATGLHNPTLHIALSVREWFPEFERESKFRTRVRQSVDEYLNSYVAERRALAEIPPSKRKPRKDVAHFKWAVLFQVAEWEYSRIAKEHNVVEQAVREGVASVANWIGLNLRRRSRGRPRVKTKDLSK